MDRLLLIILSFIALVSLFHLIFQNSIFTSANLKKVEQEIPEEEQEYKHSHVTEEEVDSEVSHQATTISPTPEEEDESLPTSEDDEPSSTLGLTRGEEKAFNAFTKNMCTNMCNRTNKSGNCISKCLSCVAKIPGNATDEQATNMQKACGIKPEDMAKMAQDIQAPEYFENFSSNAGLLQSMNEFRL